MINCPLDNCTYSTPDIDSGVAAFLLNLYNNIHINVNASSSKPKSSKMNVVKRFETHFCKNEQCLKIAQRFRFRKILSVVSVLRRNVSILKCKRCKT